MDEGALRDARTCAKRDGLSLSAWLTQAARGKQMADNGKLYRAAQEARSDEEKTADDDLMAENLRRVAESGDQW